MREATATDAAGTDGLGAVRAAATRHLDSALDRLAEFVAIPSVSSDAAHAADVRRAARWIADEAGRWGAADARLLDTNGAPVALARFTASTPSAPTVVVYCHYDVQPAEPLDAWTSPPYRLTRRGDHLYGRGAADDKGPILTHLAALAAWVDDGGPPVDVVLLLDGEEESGSTHLRSALEAAELTTDLLVVSDTSILGEGRPSLCYGLRGICVLAVSLRVADRDLHSGRFGGVAPNAAHELACLITTLHDDRGAVAVPGFTDRVRPLDGAERDRLHRLGVDDAQLLAGTGVRPPADASGPYGEAGRHALERAWARPSLDVNGIASGHAGNGTKTVIPATATATLSARLVPDQSPDEIAAQITAHLRANAPSHVTVDVTVLQRGRPLLTAPDTPVASVALAAYRAGYGVEPELTREGGSVPVIGEVAAHLGATPVLLGFGLPDQAEHAPDERLSIPNAARAVRTLATFWGLVPRALPTTADRTLDGEPKEAP